MQHDSMSMTTPGGDYSRRQAALRAERDEARRWACALLKERNDWQEAEHEMAQERTRWRAAAERMEAERDEALAECTALVEEREYHGCFAVEPPEQHTCGSVDAGCDWPGMCG